MVYDYFDLVKKSQLWAEQAHASGWIDSATERQFREIDTRTPSSLFNESTTRPLLVAFMGGTGVGKSSLLNRLAGRAIARTGVERPTSHEVTLFHHHTVAFQNLPENLPLDSARIAQHNDESKKNIIWIDMPDIDSIEQKNKNLVLAWLPHIDVLIYVVSPERYRDDKEWRVLVSEGNRHAWVFVFNQWDKGYPEQYQDFNKQLHKAGLNDPIIFKTSCNNTTIETDEFFILESTLCNIATENTINHLELKNLQIKRDELTIFLKNCQKKLGTEESFRIILELWNDQWQKTTDVLKQGFVFPIKQLSHYYADHASDLITTTNINPGSIWDDWAQTRFDDALNEFITNVNQFNVPTSPLKTQLSFIHQKAPKIIQTNCQLAVREALANPGNLLQRNLLKIIRSLEILLPLLCIGWVGYQVFIGFYHSNISNSNYLGVDFAVHSSLLIAISWLAPFFILKRIKPSLEKSAQKGLNKGIIQAMNAINITVLEVIEHINNQHQVQILQIDEMIEKSSSNNASLAVEKDSLSRMLIE